MSSSEMAVIIDQHQGFKPFSRASFTNFDYNDVIQISQANFTHRSYSTPCLTLSSDGEDEIETRQRIEIVAGRGAPRLRALVVEVAIALASGVQPIPVTNGLGGAYFLPSRNGDIIAVAKPIDEEPLAFNNPKGFGGLMFGQPGLKRSVRVGETGIRELAAYLLDHDGFAGVPPTALVKISDVAFNVNDSVEEMVTNTPFKIASLQRFVQHECDAGDLGPSGFSVSSIHRIGIFDVRLLNLDRHAGNLLVMKQDRNENYAVEATELVPIDHGLCLPEWLDDPYFEWLHWPQASIPFSDTEMEYINKLDPFKDAEMLRNELPSIRECSIRILVLCTIFLKRAAVAGLCLADIGEIMTREFSGEENLSVLETLCARAKASVMMNNNISDYEEDYNNGDEDHYHYQYHYHDHVIGTCYDDQSRDNEKEFEMFQFDNESEEQNNSTNEHMELPRLMIHNLPAAISKPPKIPSKFSTVKSLPHLQDLALSPLYETETETETETQTEPEIETKAKEEDDCKDVKKAMTCFTKSLSFSAQSNNYHYHDLNGEITLGDMNGSEWELFLECFEKMLPQVFENVMSMGLKQRLGSSCEF